jgi:hypothetical protein
MKIIPSLTAVLVLVSLSSSQSAEATTIITGLSVSTLAVATLHRQGLIRRTTAGDSEANVRVHPLDQVLKGQ